jgi:hypothetical protein
MPDKSILPTIAGFGIMVVLIRAPELTPMQIKAGNDISKPSWCCAREHQLSRVILDRAAARSIPVVP